MELTSNALSPSAKPVILACSPSRIVTLPPGGAFGRDFLCVARVGHGDFTVEADKAKLGPMLRDLIIARKRLALAGGDMIMYRVLHAAAAWLLDGCSDAAAELEPYEQWMAAMRFETVKDNVHSSGQTPLHFAVMSGRADLVEALLDQGAPINFKLKKDEPRFYMNAGDTPLAFAATFASNSSIIELLLQRGADPRESLDRFGNTALHAACSFSNMDGVRALMRHDETLAVIRNKAGGLPLANGAVLSRPRVLSLLRDEYPQQFEFCVREHDTARNNGLGLCANAIANGTATVESLTIILDAGEPVDRYSPKVTGILAPIIHVVDIIAWLTPMTTLRKKNELVFGFAYGGRSSPLHTAAGRGMLAVVDLLLERGASINSTASPKGMTPLHLVAIAGHDDVCARLLEKGADPIIKDKRGRTALAYATMFKRDAVRRRLAAVTTMPPSMPLPARAAPASQSMRGISTVTV